MTDLHVPSNPVRVLTAAALFDGHDAAINIMRRILQAQGAEVIHLGHNRSVDEVVTAAIQEDVQAVAISSYQGGHVEFFSYLVQLLNERGAGHIKVFGGGGGTIVAEEIEQLHAVGVARIFSPEDGQRLGLAPMVNTIIAAGDQPLPPPPADLLQRVRSGETAALARAISLLELGQLSADQLAELTGQRKSGVVLGITGTGGSGKSSLTDELIRRFRIDQQDKVRVAVLAVDPTRRKAGGALLGDRIRMNSLGADQVYFRRWPPAAAARSCRRRCRSDQRLPGGGLDLVIVETPGIGQGDSAIVKLSTAAVRDDAEFGAASQLEKIDMLDFADVVARQQVRPARAATTPCGTSPASWCATGRHSTRARRTCRCSAPRRPATTTTG